MHLTPREQEKHVLTDFARQVWAAGRHQLLGLPPLDLRLG
jgi:hypothetical protein